MPSSDSNIVTVGTSKKRKNSSSPQQRGQVIDRPDPLPSTSQRGSPPQTRLAKIPVTVIEDAYRSLGRFILPEDDDHEIRKSLGYVWRIVQDAFKHDPTLKGYLAEENEFFDNVKGKGEQGFFNSLRDMAKHRSWEALFDDGTSLSSFDSKHSDHVLYLDVVLKHIDPSLISGAP
jgi:hypothetical protein